MLGRMIKIKDPDRPLLKPFGEHAPQSASLITEPDHDRAGMNPGIHGRQPQSIPKRINIAKHRHQVTPPHDRHRVAGSGDARPQASEDPNFDHTPHRLAFWCPGQPFKGATL